MFCDHSQQGGHSTENVVKNHVNHCINLKKDDDLHGILWSSPIIITVNTHKPMGLFRRKMVIDRWFNLNYIKEKKSYHNSVKLFE